MTTEKNPEAKVFVRGYGSFIRRASVAKRIAAAVTDLPLHLLAPFSAIVLFNQPPLPGALGLLLWLSWFLLVHFGAKRFWGTTAGGWIWGIQSFQNQGVLERTNGLRTIISSMMFMCLSLLATVVLLRTSITFHPMLRHAPLETIPQFVPADSEAQDWTELSIYFAVGSFPRQRGREAVWYFLPYGKGPPGRFPPRVIARFNGEHARLSFEGPRTPNALRGKRELIRDCLTSPAASFRLSMDCLSVRRELFQQHTTEMRPGGKSPNTWEVSWFEVVAPPESRPPAGELAMGVHVSARNDTETLHRFILINAQGQQQSFTLESRSSHDQPDGELELLKKIVGSVIVHDSLSEPLTRIEHRVQLTNFAAIRGGGTLEKLAHATALLISQATVDPANADIYFELAGVSLVLLKKSAQGLQSETVASISRPQALAAQKFMRDVAPEDSRNGQLEQMLLSLKGF